MLTARAMSPKLAEDLFLSEDESDMEFSDDKVNLYLNGKDSKMEDGKTTGFSMFTSPIPTKNRRERNKPTKRVRKSLKVISTRTITKEKVNKELVEIVPVTSTCENKIEKLDEKTIPKFTEKTRKLASLFLKTMPDLIIVRPRIVENRPWIRKPTRPLNLGKYSKLIAKRREQGIDVHIEVPKISFRIFQ